MDKIKIIRIKKLFNKDAWIRDYQVTEALKNNQHLLISLDNGREEMLISNNKVSERIKLTSKKTFTSNYNNRVYRLISFIWMPTSKQISLF